MTTEEIKLLPCPFCGGEAVDRREIDGFPMIYCDGEECFGPQTTAKTFQDAVVQWNTRLSAQADVRADVRAATIEECAKIAEEAFADPNWHMLYRMASTVIAERIRALALQEKQP